MADGHFQLDVSLESLRAAQRWTGQLAENLGAEGDKIGAAPADLGDSWTGPASETIKAEMTELGTTVSGFAEKFVSARDAVKTFADAAETFRDTTLVELNRQWDEANQDAEAAQQGVADNEDLTEEQRNRRRGEIATGLRWSLQSIAYDFSEQKDALRTKATTMGTALGDLPPVEVPDSVAADFAAGGGSGTHMTWEGFPPDLDVNGQLPGTSLSEDADQMEAGEEAASELEGLTPEEAQEYLDSLNGDSEAFRQGFLDNLDPTQLNNLHSWVASVAEDDSGALPEVISAIAAMLARGSRQKGEETPYPVNQSLYDALQDAYVPEPQNEYDTLPARGHLLLSELVRAGQGETDTWDSDLLSEITRSAIEYERQQLEVNPTFSWGDDAHHLTWPLGEATGWSGDVPARMDPITLYLDAAGYDPDAAQDIFANGGNAIDEELTEHLFGGRQEAMGWFEDYGYGLGRALEAATSFKGTGGEGTQDYMSADLVARTVGFYGEHSDRLPMSMHEPIVNMLTRHVEALNHPRESGEAFEGLVIPGIENSDLPYLGITRPNLDPGAVDGLLSEVFGTDYWSNHIAEEEGRGHEFPLYTQLALAMELSAQEEFQYVAQHGTPGQLEVLTKDISEAQQRTMNSFIAALEGEGRGEDERNADARAALNFVLGIAKDQVPTGTGVPGALASAGLGRVQSLLVDAVIPESDYEAAASEDAGTEAYRERLNRLKLIAWLDEAGQLPAENGPQQWAQTHPSNDGMLDDQGRLIDPGELFRNRTEDPDAWNDFVLYMEDTGTAWLADIDLAEQWDLGTVAGGG